MINRLWGTQRNGYLCVVMYVRKPLPREVKGLQVGAFFYRALMIISFFLLNGKPAV